LLLFLALFCINAYAISMTQCNSYTSQKNMSRLTDVDVVNEGVKQ
jgi:hypothetical protein